MWRRYLITVFVAVLLVPCFGHGESLFGSGGLSANPSWSSPGFYSPGSYDIYDPSLPLPPYQPATHHHSSSSSSGSIETVVKSTDVTGKGWTKIRDVNVRSLPSTKSSLVRQINSKESEVTVNAEVLNSAGETWYGVKLYSGHVGYIRGDLLEVEVEEVSSSDDSGATKDSSSTTKDSSAASAAEKPVIVYVVTVPDGRKITSATDDATVVYLTPEEAESLGLLTFVEDTEYYPEETDDNQPING